MGLNFVATWDKGAKAKKLMAENGLDASSFRHLQIVKVENVLKYLQEHNVDWKPEVIINEGFGESGN